MMDADQLRRWAAGFDRSCAAWARTQADEAAAKAPENAERIEALYAECRRGMRVGTFVLSPLEAPESSGA